MLCFEGIEGDADIDGGASLEGVEYFAAGFIGDFGDGGFDVLVPAIVADDGGVEDVDFVVGDVEAADFAGFFWVLPVVLVNKLLHVK